MTVEVEVSIQDCFWQHQDSEDEFSFSVGEQSTPSSRLNIECPIAVQTWEDWFCRWLELLEENLPVAVGYELNLRLTDDAEIQSLNAQYRHQNKPTDVLAFAALEDNCPQSPEMLLDQSVYLGDIIISVDTAYRQAQQQGHALKIELAWLATHGVLHLLGWDHPDDESLAEMLHQQRLLLEAVNLEI